VRRFCGTFHSLSDPLLLREALNGSIFFLIILEFNPTFAIVCRLVATDPRSAIAHQAKTVCHFPGDTRYAGCLPTLVYRAVPHHVISTTRSTLSFGKYMVSLRSPLRERAFVTPEILCRVPIPFCAGTGRDQIQGDIRDSLMSA